MSIKEAATGTLITVLIGGGAYTFSQADISKNLAEDTGMSQEQAELYVDSVTEDELLPYDQLGAEMVSDGQEILATANGIDCVNYEYEWESVSLSCQEGKIQFTKVARSMSTLGNSYIVLASDSATESDIAQTITYIDQLNADFQLPIISKVLDQVDIDEVRNTNSYNKAILKAALESE